MNFTTPGTRKAVGPPKSRMVAGIISGVIICVIVIMFAFLLWFKLCNSKKNAAREHANGPVWSLAQLSHNNTESMTSDDKTSHAKSSVSTYISAVSQNTEPSYYDRNNVTGASSTSALSGYSHLPYNPPPSPLTNRALSTISESNDPYGCPSCEHCRSTIKEVHMSEIDHNDPPPTLASTLLLEDVDMYLPLQNPPQNNGWVVNNSCNNSCQSNKCRSNKSRSRQNGVGGRRHDTYNMNGITNLNNINMNNINMNNINSLNGITNMNGIANMNGINNMNNINKLNSINTMNTLTNMNNFGSCHPNEQLLSEMDPLQNSWLYGGGEEMNSESLFDADSAFIDTKRFFRLDPPPTPCTNYLSEDEARPPSPTETELSLTFRLINPNETNYAPPPSPTSQL